MNQEERNKIINKLLNHPDIEKLIRISEGRFDEGDYPIDYDKFSVFELWINPEIDFKVKFLELRNQEGFYDVGYVQEDWYSNNFKIFDLIEELKEFVPCNEEIFDLVYVKFFAERIPNYDSDGGGTINLNFKSIKFKFKHPIEGSSKRAVVTTPEISLSKYLVKDDENKVVEDDDYKRIKDLIEEINLNIYEFCVGRVMFKPEEKQLDAADGEIKI